MKYLVLICFSFNLFAHEDHSWLHDNKAYKSVKEIPFIEAPFVKKYEDLSISEDFLKLKLQEFSGAKTIKIDNETVTITERKSTENRILARQFLIQEYEKLGYATSLQDYSNANNTKGVKWGGPEAKNLLAKKANFIAEKKGTDPGKVLIISSHLDSVGNAGANDDGSGTIAALAVAKVLKDINFTYTVRFIAFDQEEIGLVGSKAYARTISMEDKENVIGVINMEMMATNSRKDGAFHVIDCERPESTFLTAEIVKMIQVYNIDLTPSSACTDRSDHSSFWKRGIPAVVLSENFFGGDNDSCYHRKCDVVDERLDFSYMGKITKAVALAAREILLPVK